LSQKRLSFRVQLRLEASRRLLQRERGGPSEGALHLRLELIHGGPLHLALRQLLQHFHTLGLVHAAVHNAGFAPLCAATGTGTTCIAILTQREGRWMIHDVACSGCAPLVKTWSTNQLPGF
jgi:hypothetical protein